MIVRLLGRIYSHPANRSNRAAPIARFLLWQAYKRFIDKRLTITIFDNYKWSCNPQGTAAGELLYANENLCDFHEMRFMKAYLRPGDGFLDVGANAGIYTILAHSLVGNSGTIHSFEPDPGCALELTHNLSINDISSATVHNVAVSDKPGTLSFTTGRDTTNHVVLNDGAQDDTQVVEAVRLDDVLQGTNRLSMGKMDIEGAEPLAFAGATEMLKAGNPPVWLLEMNGLLSRFGSTETELVDWLASYGYRLGYYDGHLNELVLDQNAWQIRSNVLAISNEAIEDVRKRLLSGVIA